MKSFIFITVIFLENYKKEKKAFFIVQEVKKILCGCRDSPCWSFQIIFLFFLYVLYSYTHKYSSHYI